MNAEGESSSYLLCIEEKRFDVAAKYLEDHTKHIMLDLRPREIIDTYITLRFNGRDKDAKTLLTKIREDPLNDIKRLETEMTLYRIVLNDLENLIKA